MTRTGINKTMVCMTCGDIVKGDRCGFCEEHQLSHEVKPIQMPDPIEQVFIRNISNESRLMLIQARGMVS